MLSGVEQDKALSVVYAFRWTVRRIREYFR